MSNEIVLTIRAQTEEAAAKLQQFCNQVNSGLQQVSAGSAPVISGLRQVRETSLLAREGFHGLEASVLLLGGPHMMELGRGLMAARMGLMTLRTTSILTGAGLATLLPIFGAIAAALGGGLLVWGAYRAEQEAATKAANDMAEALKKIPEQLTAIHTAARAGILPKGEAEAMTQQLQNASLTPAPNPKDAGWFRKFWTTGNIGIGPLDRASGAVNELKREQARFDETLPGVQEKVNERLASLGVLLKTVDEKTGKPSYEKNPELEAVEDLRKLQKQASLEVLAGYDKERSAARQAHDDQIDQLNQRMQLAQNARRQLQENLAKQSDPAIKKALQEEITALDAQKFTALKTQLDTGLTSKLADVDFKQRKEDQQAAEEAFRKSEADSAKRVNEQETELEHKLTLDAAQEGETRRHNFEHEYADRVRLYIEEYYAGDLTEKQYTQKVEAATAKRLEARRLEEKEATRVRLETQETTEKEALLKLDSTLQAVESDYLLTTSEKYEQRLLILRQTEAQLQTYIATLKEEAKAQEPATAAQTLNRADQYERQLVRTRHEMDAMGPSPTDFGGQITDSFTKAQNQIGTGAQAMGKAFAAPFLSAVNAISSGLEGLLEGTKTWGQAMSSIGIGVLKGISQAISQMIADWVVGLAMMLIKWLAMHAGLAAVSGAFRAGETAGQAASTASQTALHTTGESVKTAATTTAAAAREVVIGGETAGYAALTGEQVALHTAAEETKTTTTGAGAIQRGVIRLGETVFHAVQVTLRIGAHLAAETFMTAVTLAQSALRIAAVMAEAIVYIIQAAVEAMSAVASIPYVGPALALAALGAILAAGFGAIGGSRESGGPVAAGTSYIVGERGREWFVPKESGTIFDAARTKEMVSTSAAAVTTARLGLTAIGSTMNRAGTVQGEAIQSDRRKADVFVPQSAASIFSRDQTVERRSGSGDMEAARATRRGNETRIEMHVHVWGDAAGQMEQHIRRNPRVKHAVIDTVAGNAHLIPSRA